MAVREEIIGLPALIYGITDELSISRMVFLIGDTLFRRMGLAGDNKIDEKEVGR